MLYRIPVILSTVNVASGRNQPAIAPLEDALPGVVAVDRTTINAWDDAGFKLAVRASGRRKLIMAALWTEACLTFPSLDAMGEGYEIYAVTDAVGGTSLVAHQAGLDRVIQAGLSRPAWFRSLANCSGTGPAKRPRRASLGSCLAAIDRWPALVATSRELTPAADGHQCMIRSARVADASKCKRQYLSGQSVDRSTLLQPSARRVSRKGRPRWQSALSSKRRP
jgi:hypothetical protein